jgi:fibrillarin-like pre-rRNA processing protein
MDILPLKIENVYEIEHNIATINLVPGEKVYDERIVKNGFDEYRIWDPGRSKLAAIIVKGYSIPINKKSRVLYLGAASGTTASHLSDICAEGIVYAVEFSAKPMQKLIRVCEHRPNMVPIFADAAQPNEYAYLVGEVDLIYQDVAQREQAAIATLNADFFLKESDILILMLKARSIDSTRSPKDVIEKEIKKLDKFNVVERINLEPFHRDHAALIARKL